VEAVEAAEMPAASSAARAELAATAATAPQPEAVRRPVVTVVTEAPAVAQAALAAPRVVAQAFK
jgi:hypothetical protein